MKKATVSSQRRPAPTYPSKLPTASNQGSPDCWRGGSSGPAPRLGLERSKQSVWGPSGAAPSAISTPRSAGSPGGGKFGCCWQPLRFVRAPAAAARSLQGLAPPRPPTYWAGARAPRVRAKWLGRTHFWEPWPLPPGAGERILPCGRREKDGGGGGRDRSPRRSEGKQQEAARSAPEGFRSADLAGAAAAGMLEASPRCQQRHPRSRHGARTERKAGSCGGATPARRPPLAPPDPGRALHWSAAAGIRELRGPP